MNKAAGIVLMGMLVTAYAMAAKPPEPITWRPVDVTGPALFVAEVTQVEDFKNLPGMEYACHTVPTGSQKDASGCFSNACGLERMTLKIGQVLQGTVPPQVSLNHPLGEWCKGLSLSGRKFLIAVFPDGEWSALEVLDHKGQTLALPDIGGCLGKVDLPALLQKGGIDLDSAMDASMDWRREWAPIPGGDCRSWMPESLDKKALPLAAVVDAWKAQY